MHAMCCRSSQRKSSGSTSDVSSMFADFSLMVVELWWRCGRGRGMWGTRESEMVRGRGDRHAAELCLVVYNRLREHVRGNVEQEWKSRGEEGGEGKAEQQLITKARHTSRGILACLRTEAQLHQPRTHVNTCTPHHLTARKKKERKNEKP